MKPRSEELVRLIEPGHTYLVGEGLTERSAPSLSRILEGVGYATDYSAIDESTVQHAAARGTLVHQAIAGYWDGHDPFSVIAGDILQFEARPRVESFLRWAALVKPEPLIWETPGYNPDWRYACTEDLVCLIDGDPLVLDIKTTYKVSKITAIQTIGQALVYDERPHAFKRGALWIPDPKRGLAARIVPFTNDVQDYTTLQAIMTAHNNRGLYV